MNEIHGAHGALVLPPEDTAFGNTLSQVLELLVPAHPLHGRPSFRSQWPSDSGLPVSSRKTRLISISTRG
ncbi:hypothetical protein SCP_0501720 [Sparassis crispa]|uniref:Uncharacterized protein n=1 Tax=Sparassis crispa TaxID=139825 RepID=A0A401GLR3_9APHY|nr:hypothetical protein SCP_0501720 [Sparassis crispa]GBE83125.1 hypothetical protein SCP_0501720 [Sparassis crispa]